MEDLSAGDLKVAVRTAEGGAAVELHWNGKSNDRQPSRVLMPFLRIALEEARTARRSLEMHFEQIVHFNSSTIATLIEFILEAKASGVILEFVYDENLKWQRLSFDTLKKVTARDPSVRLRSI